jgi:hypothetical protein
MTIEINTPPELGAFIPASSREFELLQQIEGSLAQIDWQRYQQLIEKRRAETLTSIEQNELIAFSDHLEAINSDRIHNLVKLAQIRNTTVNNLMIQLGLKPLNNA